MLGPKSQAVIDRVNKHSAHHYERLPVVFVRGEGVRLWDMDGREYIDMLGTYSALNVGHCHPRIVKVLREQAGVLANVSNAVYTPQYADFVDGLTDFCCLGRVLPKNSGVEAWESAVKISRKWGYVEKGVELNKAEIIVCTGAFHGRTLAAISAMQKCEMFGPPVPGFRWIPFGDVKALEEAITENTVAFIVEPIQGEGGINVPPDDYLGQVENICFEHDILFVLDEIQTGFYRTGKRFAFWWDECETPDLLIVGKALGGGLLPVSAVVGRDEVMGPDVIGPGDDGSTFGGNPLACAVAVEALKILEKERLGDNALRLGEYFMGCLSGMNSHHIKDVRGRGLMIGLELRAGGRKFCEKMLEEGVLCTETRNNVVRFAPPLIITKGEIDMVLDKIKYVLESF